MPGRHRKRILVPLSLAPPDEARLLSIAAEQARALDAELILAHVLPPRAVAPDGSVSPAEAHARTYLDVAVAQLRALGTPAVPLVRLGSAAAAVVEMVREHRPLLVVLGSGGRTGLLHRFAAGPGGTAGAIAREAPCPALLVRPAGAPAGPAPRPAPGPRPGGGPGDPGPAPRTGGGAGTLAGALAPLRPAAPGVRAFAADAARAGPTVSHLLGSRTVEVARIVGSVDRSADLRADFRPRRGSPGAAAHHQRIVAAMERSEQLPPVELYRLGFGYYVRDGHHRVAAAKRLDQRWIDAAVTEFVPRGDAAAQRVFAERQAFERTTGLVEVEVTRPGNYARLHALIRDYGAHHALTARGDLREAARRWYAREFRPLGVRWRAQLLRLHLPGERVDDVLCRLIHHRRRESVRQARELTWEEAVRGLAAAQDAQREAGPAQRAA